MKMVRCITVKAKNHCDIEELPAMLDKALCQWQNNGWKVKKVTCIPTKAYMGVDFGYCDTVVYGIVIECDDEEEDDDS